MNNVKQTMLATVKTRMDAVEYLLENNTHIHDPELFVFCLDRARAVWTILDEADKDYLEAATFAFKTGMVWAKTQKEHKNEA